MGETCGIGVRKGFFSRNGPGKLPGLRHEQWISTRTTDVGRVHNDHASARRVRDHGDPQCKDEDEDKDLQVSGRAEVGRCSVPARGAMIQLK